MIERIIIANSQSFSKQLVSCQVGYDCGPQQSLEALGLWRQHKTDSLHPRIRSDESPGGSVPIGSFWLPVEEKLTFQASGRRCWRRWAVADVIGAAKRWPYTPKIEPFEKRQLVYPYLPNVVCSQKERTPWTYCSSSSSVSQIIANRVQPFAPQKTT